MRKLGLLAATLAITTAVAGCGSATHHTASPTTVPPDPGRVPAQVVWKSWEGVQLPYSIVDGPATISGAAAGYSHTPQGAVLAAIQDSLRTSLSPDSLWSQVAAQSLVTGPGKDAFVLARAQFSITGPADPRIAPAVAGYHFTTYTPGRAEIALYTRFPDKSLAAYHHLMTWTGGDWRLVLPDPGAKNPVMESIPALPSGTVRFEATR
ncbi:hypothetical protein [Nocardia sp. NBC_01327]|uniref:hypothetical protein n=1 Tax=Nocardia sp. NBC_01327 TaxID=2903593 RepID=UPI002E127633|nr:hypothetical protein OG326_42550 [Nocardia sp. NBC_01327]